MSTGTTMSATLSVQLHGEGFAAALQSGIHRVINDQDRLNAINVFPVPDGDTGTNLSLSLGSALPTLRNPRETHLGKLLARIADDLLDGSRGNSGAIVAQFFQGMSDAAEDVAEFTTRSFADAVSLGNDYAHDALSNPREGTILSVIAAFSATVRELASRDGGDHFRPVLTGAIEATRKALAHTPDQLDALRKAGVVDAGAKGFLDLVEGMVDYLVHGKSVPEPDLSRLPDEGVITETAGEDGELGFRFCTECIVTGTDIDRRKLRETLSALGDSLVLAGTKRKAKIHIHVNEPEAVFRAAQRYGALSGEKADDMLRQQHSTHGVSSRFAVITDSAADIPDELLETHDIHIVPLRLQFGERGYLDKVSISSSEFYNELRTNPVHPTTSQPSPGDFRRQYQFLASHYPDVISISLTGQVSGTLQAAQNAAGRITASGKVHVVNTLNASLGQGLLAVLAAECAAAGFDTAQTLDVLNRAIPDTITFAIIKDLSYAVRGGRVPRSRKLAADLLRITPVLKTTPDGHVSSAGVLPGRRKPLKGFARYVAEHAPPGKLRFMVGHAECPDDASALEALLLESLPGSTSLGITPIGTAIGVHAGPGALVVGVQHRIDLAAIGDGAGD
jgi:DegV family protein with EDD domain